MLPKGWRLRALVFKADNATVEKLTEQGLDVVRGDLEDSASLERAVRGVYGVYSVQDFWSVGTEREVRQGKNLADAAKRAGVEHFVYSSAGGAERNSGIDHFESKWEIENYIRKLGLPATMIRPVAFMENYYIESSRNRDSEGQAERSNSRRQTLSDHCRRRYRGLCSPGL